jgi:putative lipase involved disintegration of autophagic bodies
MSVEIETIVTIKGQDGVERTGPLVAHNLVSIIDKIEETTVYGTPVSQKNFVTVTCDADNYCANSIVDATFETHPKTFSFEDDGSGAEKFIKDVASVVIMADYQGNKSVFCSSECASGYLRRASKLVNVIEFPAGKGARIPESGK